MQNDTHACVYAMSLLDPVFMLFVPGTRAASIAAVLDSGASEVMENRHRTLKFLTPSDTYIVCHTLWQYLCA